MYDSWILYFYTFNRRVKTDYVELLEDIIIRFENAWGCCKRLFLVHILQKLIITSIFLLFCTKITLITMAIILDNSVIKISYCS